ncbi:hypothetical protein [Paraburkholderia terricola]|uniref:hypothetical protein n=1 Tax=Paraburkholderia terricola TaxID=169427 RepID=UPI000DEFABBE|nr:hypothetical protein [Paraburkholderia terricola]AXE96122.1 hypothetical protein CUJ90_28275 [Paraburkholderia terricola]
MPLHTTSPEDAGQDQPVKRGPGRPRKQRPASPESTPADTGPRVTDRFGVSRMVGKSHSTIKRLEQNDPDWPKPFALGCGHACNYLISDIEAFLLKKAAAAQAASVASTQTATPRGPENLRPGNKARHPEKKQTKTVTEPA